MAWYVCMGGGSSPAPVIGGDYKNIWDGESLIADTYIYRGTGVETHYDGWSSTDYLDVSGKSYVYRIGKVSTAAYNAFYDSNKTYISSFANEQITQVPQNAAYVRFSATNSDMVGKIIVDL